MPAVLFLCPRSPMSSHPRSYAVSAGEVVPRSPPLLTLSLPALALFYRQFPRWPGCDPRTDGGGISIHDIPGQGDHVSRLHKAAVY